MKQNDIENLSPFERHYRARQTLIRATLMRLIIAAALVCVIIFCQLKGSVLGIMIFAIMADLALLAPAWKAMKDQEKELDKLEGVGEDAE